jgi:N-acetylmuramoyl-L-alanine amidase
LQVLLLLPLLFAALAFSAPAQQSSVPAASKSPAPHLPPPPPLPSSLPPAAPARPAELRYIVVIDPAHGGTEPGAMLNTTPEKEYTLALATRLRTLLNNRSIRSTLTRNSDTTVATDTRATEANRAHAAACIVLHATATGNGIHLFTSSLPPAAKQFSTDTRRIFLPWQSAQASYKTQSLRLESDINSAFARQHIPVLLNQTSLAPLDNLACPAVAVEVAPLNANTPVSDPNYRENVAQALAAALVSWRTDWRMQP